MPKNLSSQLRSYLPQQALDLLRDAGELGQKIFLVGGVVRDLFLDRSNLDFDLVVENDAIELAQKLAKNRQVKLTIHSRFGTAKLNFSDFSVDVATARRESYKYPGALPNVHQGTITDDLFRRDFSVNAMALDITPGRFGELIDLYHGQQDIDNRLIRILHPDSFRDDSTRIFRAIRYEQRLGFSLEPRTAELLQRDIAMIKTLSGDRIRHELMLILLEEFPERALKRVSEFGVLRELHSSLTGDEWLIEIFEKARQLQKRSSLSTLYLSLLIYRLGEAENEQFLGLLNFPKTLAETMRQTLNLKLRLNRLTNFELKPSDIYQLLHHYTLQAVQANMLASQSDIVKQHIRLYLTKLRYSKPLLTGDDLNQIGIPSGPELGKMLNSLHIAKLDGKVKTRLDEEQMIRSWLRR